MSKDMARFIILRVVLAAVLIAAGAGAGVLWGRFTAKPPLLGVQVTEHLANTSTVLVAVRELARLESVSFHMERVIDLKERQARLFGLLQADDAILLVAAGDVSAGIDLAKMQDGDVLIEPDARRARIVVPAPEILMVRLDNQRTYVHSRKTDLLAQRNIEMETNARQHAEDSIRSAALEAGILERARKSAGHTLTALVRSLGYDRVELVWRTE